MRRIQPIAAGRWPGRSGGSRFGGFAGAPSIARRGWAWRRSPGGKRSAQRRRREGV